jgi:transcriptional regulator with XRE-family HTH domain
MIPRGTLESSPVTNYHRPVTCHQYRNINHTKQRNPLRPLAPLRKIPPGQEGVEPVPKEKPKVNIGEVIRSYRGQRGLSQGDIERRTGLLRCYLSRVENGHTVPSLETLAKIAEAMEIALADFFPGAETPRDRDTQKMLGELSEDEIRFLSEIKKYSTTLSDGDKRLVLAMIRKMATVIPPPPRKVVQRRSAY